MRNRPPGLHFLDDFERFLGRIQVFEFPDGSFHPGDLHLAGGLRLADGCVGEVRARLERPYPAGDTGFAHPEGGEQLEVAGEVLCEFVQPVAVRFAVAHGGNLQAVRVQADAVVGEVRQFLLVRDAQEVVLRDDDARLAQVGEHLEVVERMQAVVLEIEPLGNLGRLEDLGPEG